MPVAVLEMYGADFFEPATAIRTRTHRRCRDGPRFVKLREGVAHALANYLGTDIEEFRTVYKALTERYYPGPNFEFTAFEIRDRYLRECQVDQQNWTVLPPVLPSSKALFTKYQDEVVNWLITDGIVDPECDDPQVSPIADRALSPGSGQPHLCSG